MKNVYEILKIYLTQPELMYTSVVLDNWATKVIKSDNYGFDSGLIGLGWLINFLIHENIINGNADEILEDIDDVIYKLTIKEVLNKDIDIKNLLNFITYFQQRSIYNSSAHYYRQFTHHECIKMLVEKLNIYLMAVELSIQNSSDIADVILKYSFLVKSFLNEKLVEDAFYKIFEKILLFLGDNSSNISLSILLKIGIAAKQYENFYWVEKLNRLINSKKLENENILLFDIYNTYPHVDMYYIKNNSAINENEIFFILTNIVKHVN